MKPGDRPGRYEIVARIGAGGMGEVYRARDTRLGREVAIKVLPTEFAADPERLRRFEREARATAALSHPNILAVHDMGTHEGAPYLVEELLQGESLQERLASGRLAQDEALRIADEIAKGLAAAHAKGIVHRDLKPGNVFLTRDGTVKVLDFGLAKLLPTVEAAEAETVSRSAAATTVLGGVLGTLAYMAPEQARGRPVDQRADVFAFGVVLYEVLSGERPFRGATGTDLVAAILKDEPAPLPATVPPAVAAVVARCLAKDPERRYQGAGEVRAALEAARSGSASQASRRLTVPPRRIWLLVAAAVVAAIAAATVIDPGGVRGRLLGGGAGRQAIRMAVLPFANLSGDPEQEYLSDGLTQEMISQLGRLHPQTLSVIARTSVMRYKQTATAIDQIGRELGVDYVLEGSTQREGGTVRVTAELIKVADQTQLWADTIEREMSSILALQSEVARNVAGALALKLLPSERARLADARPVDPEAYEAYLKGSQHWIKMTRVGLDTAEAYFDQALGRDPDYAPSYVGRAWVWANRAQHGFAPPDEATPRAKEAVLKALALDDTLAEAHYLLAALKAWSDWDFHAADLEWNRARELDPNDAGGLAWYAHYLAMMGRPDEAMVEIDRASSLDPFNVAIHAIRAHNLIFVRRYDEALAEARTVLTMEPGHPVGLPALFMASAAVGDFREALAAIADYQERVYGVTDLGPRLERTFADEGFEAAAAQVAELVASRAAAGEELPVDAVWMYILAGDAPNALDWLERAYEAGDPNLPYLLVYPIYDPLRSEPRFQALVRKMGLPLGRAGEGVKK